MEKTLPEGYQLRICHIDEDREMIFSEYVERDPWPETMGDLYRALQREYGRCASKVYVDGPDGRPIHIGWYFVSREHYRDTEEPYLRGTWATVETPPEPMKSLTVTQALDTGRSLVGAGL